MATLTVLLLCGCLIILIWIASRCVSTMRDLLFYNKARVGTSCRGGRGMFATKDIRKGEVVEVCPILIGKKGQYDEDYVFTHLESSKQVVMSLGNGSLYNHSQDPNVDYSFNYALQEMTFVATKDIKRGEELLISYGDSWFEERSNLQLLECNNS